MIQLKFLEGTHKGQEGVDKHEVSKKKKNSVNLLPFNFYRWRLKISPANHIENLLLESLWCGEFMDVQRPKRF